MFENFIKSTILHAKLFSTQAIGCLYFNMIIEKGKHILNSWKLKVCVWYWL